MFLSLEVERLANVDWPWVLSGAVFLDLFRNLEWLISLLVGKECVYQVNLEPETESVAFGPKVNGDFAFIWLIFFSIDSQMGV